MATIKTVSLTKLQFDHFNGSIFDAECTLFSGGDGTATRYLTMGGTLSAETSAKIKELIEQEFADAVGVGAVPASTQKTPTPEYV